MTTPKGDELVARLRAADLLDYRGPDYEPQTKDTP